MKKNICLFIYGVGFIAGLQVLTACSEKGEASQVVAVTEKSSGGSVFGKSTEEKMDDFLTDYVKDLKEALAESDDKKAAARIHKMKEKYGPRAERLKPEVEVWEKSLSVEEKEAYEQRAENKPYIKDLIATGFSAMGRINKSPELRQAFEDLNADMNFLNDDLTDEEATGEEYPEETTDVK
jgi:hypothetical protein